MIHRHVYIIPPYYLCATIQSLIAWYNLYMPIALPTLVVVVLTLLIPSTSAQGYSLGSYYRQYTPEQCARKSQACRTTEAKCLSRIPQLAARCENSFNKRLDSCERAVYRASQFGTKCGNTRATCYVRAQRRSYSLEQYRDTVARCERSFGTCMQRGQARYQKVYANSGTCRYRAEQARTHCHESTTRREFRCETNANTCLSRLAPRCGGSLPY